MRDDAYGAVTSAAVASAPSVTQSEAAQLWKDGTPLTDACGDDMSGSVAEVKYHVASKCIVKRVPLKTSVGLPAEARLQAALREYRMHTMLYEVMGDKCRRHIARPWRTILPDVARDEHGSLLPHQALYLVQDVVTDGAGEKVAPRFDEYTDALFATEAERRSQVCATSMRTLAWCVGEAYGCLHRHGVLHADGHGQNVMVVTDAADAPIRVVIIDFGRAATCTEDDASADWASDFEDLRDEFRPRDQSLLDEAYEAYRDAARRPPSAAAAIGRKRPRDATSAS